VDCLSAAVDRLPEHSASQYTNRTMRQSSLIYGYCVLEKGVLLALAGSNSMIQNFGVKQGNFRLFYYVNQHILPFCLGAEDK